MLTVVLNQKIAEIVGMVDSRYMDVEILCWYFEILLH